MCCCARAIPFASGIGAAAACGTLAGAETGGVAVPASPKTSKSTAATDTRKLHNDIFSQLSDSVPTLLLPAGPPRVLPEVDPVREADLAPEELRALALRAEKVRVRVRVRRHGASFVPRSALHLRRAAVRDPAFRCIGNGNGRHQPPHGVRHEPARAYAPAAPTRGGGILNALTIGLLLTVSMAAFEALAVATILPETVREIGGLEWYGWAFTGFMLANLVGIPLAGEAADRRGPALPFVIGVVAFAGGLAVAGVATSMEVLVAGRVLQGGGAAALSSVAYVAVARAYPPDEQPRMMALLSSAVGVAGTLRARRSRPASRSSSVGASCSWDSRPRRCSPVRSRCAACASSVPRPKPQARRPERACATHSCCRAAWP